MAPPLVRQVAPIAVVHVFAGGEPVSAKRIRGLSAPDLVIAADSGADLAAASGVTVDVLIGDFDSISPEALEAAGRRRTRIETHDPDKDATDLQLALRAALRMDAREIVVIGGGGGRLDHLFGNVAAITDPALAGVPIHWITERETVYVVRTGHRIPIRPGSTFSLVPIGGDARGVTLTGSKWTLDDRTLRSGDTLGISNRALRPEISVSVRTGTLLLICPTDTSPA